MIPPALAYIGVGSNLGLGGEGPEEAVKKGIASLSGLPQTKVLRVSALYRTAPFGVETKRPFVNAAVELETGLGPRELLSRLLSIEASFGRDRSKGPDRTLDLDILYYGNRVISEHGLSIPHPRLAARAFVLVPWAEIAPGLHVSPWGLEVGELLSRLGPADGSVERIEG